MSSSVATDFRHAGVESTHLASYLSTASALERVMAGKAARARYLGNVASSVADLGCGPGDMLDLFAQDARWNRIIGVDHNSALLNNAARVTDPRVELVQSDAANLPLADGEVGAVLIERTLQHVQDPAAVLAEAVRVVAPDGVVLVVEPDWSTLGVDGGDPAVTEAVLNAVQSLIRNPFVGRGLRGLLNRAGLSDITVDAEVHETSDLDIARLLGILDDGVAEIRRTGTISDEALDSWQAELADAAASGDFSASLVLFVAVGRVPVP